MNRKELVTELETEIKDLEERLGNARMAYRALSPDKVTAVRSMVQDRPPRQRVHITPEMRKKYVDDLYNVIEAYGPCTVNQLRERGDFGNLSSTSVYRLALSHPDLVSDTRGRTLVFSLNKA